jgi:hypothetical protein
VLLARFSAAQSRRTQPLGQRPPAGDRAHAQSRLRIVQNAWKQLAQLDGSREFATLLVGGADYGSLGFRDDEHRQSMAYADRRVQVLADAAWLAKLKGATFGAPVRRSGRFGT